MTVRDGARRLRLESGKAIPCSEEWKRREKGEGFGRK